MKIIRVEDLDIYSSTYAYSDLGFKKFKEYLKNNNGYYYCREKEEFFLNEAVTLAEENKADVLIVENLS